MARSVLDKAVRLAASGRHGEAVALLEPNLPIYRESHRFYYVLGSSCLRCNDTGGAWTYLKRAEQLEPSHRETLLLVAAIHLRRGEVQKAIEYYLRVLEEHPGDALASRSLAWLRRKDAEEALARLVDEGGFERFLPRSRSLPPFALPAMLVLVACVLLWLSLPFAKDLLERVKAARAPRPEVAAISLSQEERLSPVDGTGSFRYILTEKEALAAFEKAKAHFQSYRDNAALIEINRLLLSNASTSIKEKARTLKAFVRAPDFRNLADVPDYAAVAKEPELYLGCIVNWKGRAANIVEQGGSTGFHFLVGYVDRAKLDGIVPASMRGEKILVPADSAFEFLATVSLDKGQLFLQGAAIHELRSAP